MLLLTFERKICFIFQQNSYSKLIMNDYDTNWYSSKWKEYSKHLRFVVYDVCIKQWIAVNQQLCVFGMREKKRSEIYWKCLNVTTVWCSMTLASPNKKKTRNALCKHHKMLRFFASSYLWSFHFTGGALGSIPSKCGKRTKSKYINVILFDENGPSL